jgi:hypothetical protein
MVAGPTGACQAVVVLGVYMEHSRARVLPCYKSCDQDFRRPFVLQTGLLTATTGPGRLLRTRPPTTGEGTTNTTHKGES